MVTQSARHTGITLPITTEFQRAAEQFAQQCPFGEKAERVRRNVLAVCAVNAYLQLMDISTQLGQSDSWNPMMHALSDAADLQVTGVGSLECRPLAMEDNTCYVPPEAWHERAGYIAVVIDEAAGEATLLGFAATVAEIEQVPVDSFAPIETLLDRVHDLQAQPVSAAMAAAVTQLGQWVEGAIALGWQAVDDLINPAEMAFSFRTTAELVARETNANISRAKLVDLGIQLGQSVRVALVIHLTQTEDNRTDVTLQVRPLGESPYLPEDLALTVIDGEGTDFMSATSRAIDNYIQLRLSGQAGETFGVRVAMGETAFEEQFSL